MKDNDTLTNNDKKQLDGIVDDRGYTYDPTKPNCGLNDSAFATYHSMIQKKKSTSSEVALGDDSFSSKAK